jgi:hypothetical protein
MLNLKTRKKGRTILIQQSNFFLPGFLTQIKGGDVTKINIYNFWKY